MLNARCLRSNSSNASRSASPALTEYVPSEPSAFLQRILSITELKKSWFYKLPNASRSMPPPLEVELLGSSRRGRFTDS